MRASNSRSSWKKPAPTIGDGGEALDRRHVARMLTEIRLVDGKVCLERQQHRRDHAVGNVTCVSWYWASPSFPLIPVQVGIQNNRFRNL
jgi:hypothetical protein